MSPFSDILGLQEHIFCFFFIWVGIFFYSQRGEFLRSLYNAQLPIIFLGIVPQFIAIGIINPYIHRFAYKEIGTNISFRQAFQIFHLSRIGNYLPGRIWFVTNYYLLSRKMNITTERIAKNIVVLNALFIFVGGLFSFFIVSLINPAAQKFLILILFWQ